MRAARQTRHRPLLRWPFLFLLGACGDPIRPIADVSHSHAASPASADDWDAPRNLGSDINSTSSELQLGIAPNGRALYVSSDRPGTFGQQDLWVSRKQRDGSWGTLENLGPVVNSSLLDSSPTLSVDGHYLYFSSRRAGGFGGLDCWRSYRHDVADDFGWQPPENLGPTINTSTDEADCFPERDTGGHETLWFTSLNRPGGQGDWDIYTSEIARDGTFGPASPVLELNSPFRDTRMTITGDGRRIFFSSNRPGGLGGIDIWSAERATPKGRFCAPENLGPAVNSPQNDRSPSISTHGTELYFTSTRPGGLGSDDVYAVRRLGGHGPRDCKL